MSEKFNFDYKKLHPFKWYILENFPFLEDSIDTLTNYQLFCKLGEMYNKEVDSINTLGIQVEGLTDWFDNLDVQDEINNKLDEMATDGTLENIINQQIFSDLNDAITNVQNNVDTVQENVDTLKRNAIYIGNSYCDGVGSSSGSSGLFNLTKGMFNKAYSKTSGGIGFLSYTDHSTTFQTMLENAINDSNINNSEITDIIVVSAWGDTRALHESTTWSTFRANLQTAIISFVTTAKNNFTNIKKISCVLAESQGVKHINDQSIYDDAFWVHNSFKELAPKNGMEYMGWIGFNLWLQTNYFSNDNYHPADSGYKYLSTLFKTAYSGNIEYVPYIQSWGSRAVDITEGSTCAGTSVLLPDHADLYISSLTLAAGSTPGHGATCSLFDFANTNWSLPMPAGESSEFYLASGLNCTTQGLSDSAYNPINNYNAKVLLRRSTNSVDSTMLKLQTFGTSKTVSGQVNSIIIPYHFGWNLSRKM